MIAMASGDEMSGRDGDGAGRGKYAGECDTRKLVMRPAVGW
jgi:hypothetical protein